jgi:hypothetical protein
MVRFLLSGLACCVLFSFLVGDVCAEQPSVISVSGTNKNSDSLRELLADRRASLRRMGDASNFGFYNNYVRSHDILAATALQGCGKEEWRDFMVELPVMGTGHDPTEMFSLVPLVRYLYQFGQCLTGEQKLKLLAKLNKPQFLFGHGTLNQAIVQSSSWYLLAQFFPGAKWTDVQSHQVYTSTQLMAGLKPLLEARTHRIFQSGHYEWLSPNYALLNIYPLLNLIDFAEDNTIKSNAGDEVTLEIAVLKVDSFHGVIVPPLTRKNVDQRNATDTPKDYQPAISQLALWYYFGEPSALTMYDFRVGGAFFTSMLGMSDWLPPAAVLGMQTSANPKDMHTVKVVTPRFTIWGNPAVPEIYGDSLITDDFSIGTGNLMFDPYDYSGHIQTFSILLKSDKPHNEIECYQPYWHSSAGEDAWGTDRSSPFQQMMRYDDSSVVMLFDIPKTDPWKAEPGNRFWPDRSNHQDALLQLVTCRFARDFDEIVEEPNWVFVRQGNVFVAMETLKGKNEYDDASPQLERHFKVVKVRESKTALFFRVDNQRPDFSFAQFRLTVRNNLPVYDPATSSITVVEKNGTKTQLFFELTKPAKGNFWGALPRVIKDGKPLSYDASYALRAPNLTLRNGTLHIGTTSGDELNLTH